MAEILTKQHGQRVVSAETTLERVRPHWQHLGLTRVANVTGLDRLGMPVYCAIRPSGIVLQTAHGKGLRAADAMASAVMEALEVHHAERPPAEGFNEQIFSLQNPKGGYACVDPRSLPEFLNNHYFDESMLQPWVLADELQSGEKVWLPASVVHCLDPSLFRWSTNGLASGNHIVEATLHALYELLERDALARMRHHQGSLLASLKVVDLASITEPLLQGLLQQISAAGLKLVMSWVRSAVPVHTFWAKLLDPNPLGYSTMVNAGYGCHWSPTVAAVRAITEAAQSRLSVIHASREDLLFKRVYHDAKFVQEVYERFDRAEPSMLWRSAVDRSKAHLGADLQLLLGALGRLGFSKVYRANLTQQPFCMPVVKIVVPGLLFHEEWL